MLGEELKIATDATEKNLLEKKLHLAEIKLRAAKAA